ncbi:MAG: CotH kinase family protein [Oscillospiraceae bacterium]
MTRHKYTNVLCAVIVCIALVLTGCIILFGSPDDSGDSGKTMDYESTLFDTSYVHTLNIVIDDSDWQDLLDNAQEKNYYACDIVIDGEDFQDVAIRTKGNSSLTSAQNDRYSFKIEFDHYQDGKTAWGLDKLNLNNIIGDNTYMKDYITYTMMSDFGADSPLCSYIYVTINGEDFGLYLAVEGVEESFAERNYGEDYGDIYKPDSQNDAAGGNQAQNDGNAQQPTAENDGDASEVPTQDTGEPSETQAQTEDNGNQNLIADPETGADTQTDTAQSDDEKTFAGMRGQIPGNGGGMSGGDSSASAVALQYLGDDSDSYSAIFDNAMTDVTDEDKERLIASLEKLNSGEDIDEVVNVDEVLRYFVVHNFVCNFDSYTGSMKHNYYLYEDGGQLSMIAWDYNLAFGAFNMSGGSNSTGIDSTTQMVNLPIDTPLSGCTLTDRPMLNALLSDESYLSQYHAYYDEFLSNYIENGWLSELIRETSDLIAPYVESDPTAYCTYDEFLTGTDTLATFCELRAESIRGQLDGIYPLTSDEQTYAEGTYVDASAISISDMGDGIGGNKGGNTGNGQLEDGNFAGGGAAGPGQGGQGFPNAENQDTETSEQNVADAVSGATQPDGTDSSQQPDSKSRPPQSDGENGGHNNAPGGNLGGAQQEQDSSSASDDQTAAYLGGCAAVLIAALVFIKFFRGKRKIKKKRA